MDCCSKGKYSIDSYPRTFFSLWINIWIEFFLVVSLQFLCCWNKLVMRSFMSFICLTCQSNVHCNQNKNKTPTSTALYNPWKKSSLLSLLLKQFHLTYLFCMRWVEEFFFIVLELWNQDHESNESKTRDKDINKEYFIFYEWEGIWEPKTWKEASTRSLGLSS